MFNDDDRDKLETLARRINMAENAANPQTSGEGKGPNRMSRSIVRAVRLGSDFVALVVGLAFLGWGIDRHFGLAPWFMLGMILVGFCVGFWMIARSLSQSGAEEDEQKQDIEMKE